MIEEVSEQRAWGIAQGLLRMVLTIVGSVSLFAALWGSDRPWALGALHALYAALFAWLGIWGFESVGRLRSLMELAACVVCMAAIVVFHHLRLDTYGPEVDSLFGIHAGLFALAVMAAVVEWIRLHRKLSSP